MSDVDYSADLLTEIFFKYSQETETLTGGDEPIFNYELQNNFSILGSAIINEKEDSFEELDKILFQEKKEELKRRIELLLAKIPEWDEFLGPVLKELSYNTCSSEYVNEKMNVLDDLEKLYNDSIKDYKIEVNNLCLYLKSEIENSYKLQQEYIRMKLSFTERDYLSRINFSSQPRFIRKINQN